MSIGVYAAAGLVMDEVGVYCSWDMPVPGWSTLHRHLHYVPGERSFSATRVLVVCSACQGLRGWVCQPKALGWSTGWSRIFGCNWPLSHSWLDPQLYCCAKSLFSPPWYSLPPLFRELIHSLRPVPPPRSPSSILFPSLPFVFCPFTPFSLSSQGYFPLSSVVPSTDALSFSRD